MGVRYSELPTTTSPTTDDLVAILDNSSATLKTTTIDKLVKSVTGNVNIGTTSITGIGDGTITGAISYIYNNFSKVKVLSLTEAQYNALPAATKNDGNIRFVSG